MTSQHSNPVERESFVVGPHDPEAGYPMNTPESFGALLRAARQARHLDIEACAHTLKLPARVLRHLEDDNREGMDYAVYLASYITKYARHLGVDEETIQAELQSIKRAAPALVVTGGISHSRYVLERYATAATYVVLTAVIVVPMIWLGVRGTLDRDISHLAALDARPVAQRETTVARPDPALESGGTAAATDKAAVDDQPLMASMAPFPDLVDKTLRPAPPGAPAKAAATEQGSGGHSLSVDLDDASWVEVVSADGARLAYELLPAGSNRTWHSDKPLEVRIGNARGAQVSVDGQPLALDDFRHANVAHFRVQIRDGKATPVAL